MQLTDHVRPSAGKALTSDWSGNSFSMAVYWLSECSVQSTGRQHVAHYWIFR